MPTPRPGESPIRLHAFVSGQVQGVFFRAFVQREATELGLRGMVRNLDDGRVEVVAEGSWEQLEALIRRLHKGPSGALVRDVEVRWERRPFESGANRFEGSGASEAFRIEYG